MPSVQLKKSVSEVGDDSEFPKLKEGNIETKKRKHWMKHPPLNFVS